MHYIRLNISSLIIAPFQGAWGYKTNTSAARRIQINPKKAFRAWFSNFFQVSLGTLGTLGAVPKPIAAVKPSLSHNLTKHETTPIQYRQIKTLPLSLYITYCPNIGTV